LRASTGYPMPKVQTLDSEVLHSARTVCVTGRAVISAFVTVACHWTGSNGSWKLITLNSNEHHSWCLRDSGAVYKCDDLQSQVLPYWITEVVSSVFRSVLSYFYLDWPLAEDFYACQCHFCLWGKIIHSLAALAETWTWSKLVLGLRKRSAY